MQVVKSVKELRAVLDQIQEPIAFVPTMGALHKGHISLVANAKKKANFVVVSIFVNPTQFNQKSDLDKYPRTLYRDVEMLEIAGTTLVFAPEVDDIYPNGLNTVVDVNFGRLVQVMEGEFRPGHFAGMAQVVKRLLDIVKPNYLVMGQKDFQQFTIVSHMIDALRIPVELLVCPIMREPNGLAMSSRNERLTSETRDLASKIYRVLTSIKSRRKTKTVAQLIAYATNQLSDPPFKLEYISIVDGYTLEPVTDISTHAYVVACIALWADDIRLIDNIILHKTH